MQFTLKLLLSIVVFCVVCTQIQAAYEVPDVTVQALKEGLRVTMPEGEGVKFIEFHANKNSPISEKDEGEIFNRVSAPYQGKWQFTDKSIKLNKGDVLNYWVLVWHNKESYTKHGLTYKVEELL